MYRSCRTSGLTAGVWLLLAVGSGACSQGEQQQLQNKANEVTNEAVQKGGEKAKQIAGDTAVTAAVKAKLVEDAMARAAAIHVDTDNGVVTLTGTVESEQAKARAESVARQIEGVTSVVDKLTVAPPPAPVPANANQNAKR